MVASHTPFRANAAVLGRLAISQSSTSGRSWRAVHILAANCACSRAVAEHLIARGPLRNLKETIVLVGTDHELQRRLQSAAIAVTSMSADEAGGRYGLHGAPWLVFIGPDGAIRYAGGYSAERNARDGYQDVRLWNTLRAGGATAPLPAYGCAVGKRLQRNIDPLGVKYTNFGS